MPQMRFKHNDPDNFHDKEITLHDCYAEKIIYADGFLRFYLSDGFWVTPYHEENNLNRTVRTDAAVVDFRIENIDDIILDVFTRNIFKKTKSELWEMNELMNGINSGKCTIEFIHQYRTFFEQMWQCAIRSEKKPYYRECQLHLPETEAIFRWNNLRPDCEW